jgi:outer membrane lipoprotein-sorting protein
MVLDKALSAVGLLLFFVSSLQGQGAFTLDQVFAKMDDVAKNFKSTESNIERTHVTVLVNDKDIVSGKFYYTRKGKEPRLKMDLTKPAPQILLVDKGKVRLYNPNLKQVQEGSFGSNSSTAEQFMALGFGQSSQDLKKNYDVAQGGDETLDGKKMTVLNLKPKGSGMGLQTIKMWMDQQRWIAVQIQATEKGGDYGIYKFTNIKMNGSIPDSVFELKLPKDVTVLKR